jgi:hypothetical protein
VGWVGQETGARWALVVGGVAALACGVLAVPALTRIDRRAAAPPPPAPAAQPPPAPAARALANQGRS